MLYIWCVVKFVVLRGPFLVCGSLFAVKKYKILESTHVVVVGYETFGVTRNSGGGMSTDTN